MHLYASIKGRICRARAPDLVVIADDCSVHDCGISSMTNRACTPAAETLCRCSPYTYPVGSPVSQHWHCHKHPSPVYPPPQYTQTLIVCSFSCAQCLLECFEYIFTKPTHHWRGTKYPL